MTRIYLLRHGETEWNEAGERYCGRTDIPLSETGRDQARRAAAVLRDVPFVAAYASHLGRARETAAIVLAGRDLPVQPDARMAEMDYGEWEGLTRAEIAERYPAIWPRWRADPERVPAGLTGETARQVAERTDAFFRAIDDAHPEPEATVLVVGHSTSNRVYMAVSLGMPLNNYRRFVLSNTGISVVEVVNDVGTWHGINEAAHLRVAPKP